MKKTDRELVDRFLAQPELSGLSERTRSTYGSYIRCLISGLPGRHIRWQFEYNACKYGKESARSVHSVWRRFYTWCKTEGKKVPWPDDGIWVFKGLVYKYSFHAFPYDNYRRTRMNRALTLTRLVDPTLTIIDPFQWFDVFWSDLSLQEADVFLSVGVGKSSLRLSEAAVLFLRNLYQAVWADTPFKDAGRVGASLDGVSRAEGARGFYTSSGKDQRSSGDTITGAGDGSALT